MPRTTHRVLSGIPVSPGVASGRVFVHKGEHASVEPYEVDEDKVEAEIERFDRAVELTRERLRETRRMVSAKIDQAHASIFDAQEAILDDPLLTDTCRAEIREKRLNAEYVLSRTVERIREMFSQIDVPSFSLQNLDMLDVASRIRENLMESGARRDIGREARNMVIAAHDLRPSDTARLDRRRVLGIVTEAGGPTSHSAILAKALGIPAVVGVEGLLSHVSHDDEILVDGYVGRVTVHPTAADMDRFDERRRRLLVERESLQRLKDLPCETTDGYVVELGANMELPVEIDAVLESGAGGIGLFRSEFFYIDRGYIPPEEEQFQVYREVLERMAPMPVICRTLDLGGDKFLSHSGVEADSINPFLGLRAIRLCLANPDMFRGQLRAILRASAFGCCRIMLPFITDVSEIRRSREMIDDIKKELRREGIPHDADIEMGIMIETPSAALTAETLAQEADFFSIGTNDLIQYTMAVDRANESVAELYNPSHPAVIQLIMRTIDAAHRAGIWVGLCGEVAADPALAALLVGLGIDELSVSPVAVPIVKRMIRALSLEDIRHLREDVLEALDNDGADKILVQFRRRMARIVEPDTAEEKN